VIDVLGRTPSRSNVNLVLPHKGSDEPKTYEYVAHKVEAKWHYRQVKIWKHDDKFKDTVVIYLN